MTHVSPPPPRLHFLDALRVVALAVLLLYHVGMVYVSWPFHVKSPHAGPLLEPLMRLTSPWRMNLLFVISGAATALMLARSGPTTGWLRQRAGRLLLPLLAGLLLVVPPQAWVELQQRFGWTGSVADFLRLYYLHQGARPCDARGCLILPTWNHLWFLPYVMLYTTLLWALLRRWPQALDTAAARLPQWLHGPRLWLLPLAWLLATRLLLSRAFPETHALVDDPFVHSQQVGCFVLGALLARSGALWPRLQAARHVALAAALLGWAASLGLAPGVPRALLVSVQQGGALVAALGYARAHLDHDAPWLRAAGEAVFPMYVLHQTITVLVAALLLPLAWPVWAEAPVVLLATVAGSWLGWRGLRHVGPLRPWFGLAPADAPAPRGALPLRKEPFRKP